MQGDQSIKFSNKLLKLTPEFHSNVSRLLSFYFYVLIYRSNKFLSQMMQSCIKNRLILFLPHLMCSFKVTTQIWLYCLQPLQYCWTFSLYPGEWGQLLLCLFANTVERKIRRVSLCFTFLYADTFISVEYISRNYLVNRVYCTQREMYSFKCFYY